MHACSSKNEQSAAEAKVLVQRVYTFNGLFTSPKQIWKFPNISDVLTYLSRLYLLFSL